MNNTYVDIQFKGIGFSPKRLGELTKLPIEVLVEAGDLGKIGRYKGKPSPYGIGLLKVDSLENDKLISYCKILKKNKGLLKQTNVDEIVFDIETSSKNLASFSISPELNKLISSLNATLEFTQVEEEKDFYKLINFISYKLPSSGIPNRETIERLLQNIIIDGGIEENSITAKHTYGLVMYLLKNMNKDSNDTIEKISNTIMEFSE